MRVCSGECYVGALIDEVAMLVILKIVLRFQTSVIVVAVSPTSQTHAISSTNTNKRTKNMELQHAKACKLD